MTDVPMDLTAGDTGGRAREIAAVCWAKWAGRERLLGFLRKLAIEKAVDGEYGDIRVLF